MKTIVPLVGLLLANLLSPSLLGAVPVPLTGKLIPGPGGTPASILVVDGNFAAESSGSTDFGANTTAGAAVLLHDKTLGATWPVRRVITPPAALVDVADYGKSLALSGDTLAVNAAKYIFIYQQNQGGANQWGLVKTITRTNPGLGLDLQADAMAAQVLTTTSSTIVIYRRNLGGANQWGVESTVADPRAVPCEFCPVERDERAAFGGELALFGDIFATRGSLGGGPSVPEVVIDLFRRGEAGGTAWGLYRTLDRTKIAGPVEAIGKAFDWADGQLCVSTLRLTPTPGAWFHILTPPAVAGGFWPTVTGGSVSGGSEVPMSFAFQVRVGTGWAAIANLQQGATTIGVDVVLYRKTGSDWASERTVGIGPIALTSTFNNLFGNFDPTYFPDTPANRWALLHTYLASGISQGLSCDGVSLLTSVAKVPDSLTGPAGCATMHERGASSTWPLTATFNPVTPFAGDFGRSISIGGNMMAVGDPEDSELQSQSGAVDIWTRDSKLTHDWRKFGRVKADLAETGARFGRSVATDGNLLVVGAPGENSNRGAVFLYTRGPADPDTGIYTWRLRYAIRRPSDPTNTQFGYSVALGNGQIAIGAPGYPITTAPGADVTGRVFRYRPTVAGTYTAWTLSGTLAGSDSAHNSQFGSTVALEGDTIAVGAWLQTGSGAVYVFRENPPTTWTQVKKLTPSDTSRGLFGGSVSLSGNTLAVGTLPPVIFPNSGGAFVFERNQGGTNQWGETRKLTPPTSQSGWGGSVAVKGDTLIIGSSVQNYIGTASGAAFVHRRLEGGTNAWGLVRQLVPTDAASGDNFGAAVAMDDSAIAVSATGSDAGATDAGAVYTWRLGSYEIWAGAYGGPAGLTDPNGDADGDGQCNLEEFILGSHPLKPESQGRFAYHLATVGMNRYLETVWTKPGYSTAGAAVVFRSSPQLSYFGEYLQIKSDTTSQKVFRAYQPVGVQPKYFTRMEITYPSTIP